MKFFFIFCIVLLLTYSIGYWLSYSGSENIKQNINYSSCDPSKNICKISNDNIVYTISFNRQPSALVPFDVSVDMLDIQAQSIVIAFDMVDMDMGFNEYLLIKNINNWQAKVILPICSLGENEWILNVKVRLDSKENISRFSFLQSH